MADAVHDASCLAVSRAVFSEPSGGKAQAERLQEDSGAVGTAGAFLLCWPLSSRGSRLALVPPTVAEPADTATSSRNATAL